MERAVHLVLLGPHTRVVAALCAACPLGPVGCCSSPPDLSWADIGRIASLGGVEWLIEEMGAGRLLKGPRGLLVDRVTPRGAEMARCVYHAEMGCTVSTDRRSAACNYYVCREALGGEEGEEGENAGVEAASAAWTTQYQTWDEILSAEVGSWAGRGESTEEARRLFELLARRFEDLVSQ